MLELKSKLNGYKKLKVYLDTSVISYLMQIDVPDKMGKTLLKGYDDIEILTPATLLDMEV